MIRPLMVLLVLSGSVGCDKKETPPPAPAEAATVVPPATTTATPTPAEPALDLASLPVEEQFEAEAEKEISADNLTAKLDELEKEIAAP